MHRILIVDDEAQIVGDLISLLEIHGFDVVGALDRESAELMLATEFFPIILAGARLRTEGDGLRLLESIRRLSPRTRVASLTTDSTDALEEQLTAFGATLVLHKPVDGDVVVSVLRELLKEIESSEEAQDGDIESLYATSRRRLVSIAEKRYGFNRDDENESVEKRW